MSIRYAKIKPPGSWRCIKATLIWFFVGCGFFTRSQQHETKQKIYIKNRNFLIIFTKVIAENYRVGLFIKRKKNSPHPAPWRLFQKHAVSANFDIYVFIKLFPKWRNVFWPSCLLGKWYVRNRIVNRPNGQNSKGI